MTLRTPSPATVLAAAALFVALGGPAEAARTLGLKNSSVTSKKIKNQTISTVDLSPATIRKLMVTPAGSVRGDSVADGALSGADLAAGSVGGDRLTPGSVAGDRLAANSVAAGQIVDGAVGATEIAPGSVSGDEVVDGSLAAADVGRFTGRLADLDFGTIAKGTCKSVSSTSLTPVATGTQDLRDDAIAITPAANFPASGVSLAAQAVAANQIQVTVCNIAGPDNLVLGPRSFSYVSFDTTV
jgi:hypothetical protein